MKHMCIQLQEKHIEEILRRYKKATEFEWIKNPAAYLETVIYSVCFDYTLVKIRHGTYAD